MGTRTPSRSAVAIEGQARTETLIGHNPALRRRAAATRVYSRLVFGETVETILRAYKAQLRAQRL